MSAMPGNSYQVGGTPDDWEVFVNALQVLVLVADAAAKRLPQREDQDTCREVVAAAARVLELTPSVLPPVSGDSPSAATTRRAEAKSAVVYELNRDVRPET